MDRDAWNSHQWSSAQGRRLEIDAGKPLIHHQCSRCRRDFVEDLRSGERFAVHASIFSFRRFPDPITKQWLGELCPGAPLPYEMEIRNN